MEYFWGAQGARTIQYCVILYLQKYAIKVCRARQNVAASFKIVPPVTAMGQFRVRNLAGDLLLEMESESMVHLKQKVSEVCGVPEALLKVVKDNEAFGNLPDLEEIAVTDEVVELMVLVDDSPCYSWDIAGNPDSEFLKSGASAVVEFVNPDACLHPDYVNVLSQSPIEKGVHFVEFILHSLQDEQWCGVTFCASRAGRRGEQAPGVYYCLLLLWPKEQWPGPFGCAT